MSNDAARPPRILLVVGEPSGDALGGQLIDALKVITSGHVQILGVGGNLMDAPSNGCVTPTPVSGRY